MRRPAPASAEVDPRLRDECPSSARRREYPGKVVLTRRFEHQTFIRAIDVDRAGKSQECNRDGLTFPACPSSVQRYLANTHTAQPAEENQ